MNKYAEYKEAYKAMIKKALIGNKLDLAKKLLPSIATGAGIGGGAGALSSYLKDGEVDKNSIAAGILAGMLSGTGVGIMKNRVPKNPLEGRTLDLKEAINRTVEELDSLRKLNKDINTMLKKHR